MTEPVPNPTLTISIEQIANDAGYALVPLQPPVLEGPWDTLDNTKRVNAFNLRLTARELTLLKHIASVTPPSMHEFCLMAVQKALEEYESKLTSNNL